jgi:hypothetical protein
MINHISIGVENPAKVANVLAEIWDGYAFPFPPSPESFIVVANDGKGTAVEITPANIILVPGEGFPSEENFDTNTPTGEFEAKFVFSETPPKYSVTHLALNTNLSEAEIKNIGRREGWRTLTCNRGEGLFQLIEIWIDNRFMLEVFTPEMTKRYIEIMDPQFMAVAMQIPLPSKAMQRVNNLNMIG